MDKKHKNYLILIITLAFLIATICISINVFFDKDTVMTKGEIIDVFRNNQNKFDQIQNYFEQTEDVSSIYKENGKIKFDEAEAEKEINPTIYEDIRFLMGNSGVKLIMKVGKNTKFVFNSENVGMYYIKSGNKPEEQPAGYYYEEIVKNWFYFTEKPPYT